MDDYDREDEEELDELDVLQSDDRPEEDELALADGATGQPADVDEEIDELENEAATPDVTPRGPKLAMASPKNSLCVSSNSTNVCVLALCSAIWSDDALALTVDGRVG